MASRTRLSRSQAGVLALYNGGMVPQRGDGFMDWAKKAHSFVKDNQLLSKGAKALNALGATDYLDKKTGGLYSKGVAEAESRGYGRRRKRGGSKKSTRKTTTRKKTTRKRAPRRK